MEHMQYMEKAKASIKGFAPSELYIVWFCKTLQNWKALISTDTLDGVYWEVTYNGDKKETYVDEYIKNINTVIAD